MSSGALLVGIVRRWRAGDGSFRVCYTLAGYADGNEATSNDDNE